MVAEDDVLVVLETDKVRGEAQFLLLVRACTRERRGAATHPAQQRSTLTNPACPAPPPWEEQEQAMGGGGRLGFPARGRVWPAPVRGPSAAACGPRRQLPRPGADSPTSGHLGPVSAWPAWAFPVQRAIVLYTMALCRGITSLGNGPG